MINNFEQYKSTIDQLYEKYKGHFNIDRKEIALILENQKLFNETQEDRLYEKSMEIVHKIFFDSVIFDVVSVQPMLGPKSVAFYTRNIDSEELMYESEIVAKMVKVRAFSHTTSEQIISFSDELRQSIAREIFSDLRNNAGIVVSKVVTEGDIPDFDYIHKTMTEVCAVLYRKTSHEGPFWAVTSPEIGKVWAKEEKFDWGNFGIEAKKVGVLNEKWTLIVDPLFPVNQVLCGINRPNLEGYVYCPYITFGLSPVILDPENFEPIRGIFMRYSKKLLSAKPYGLVKFLSKRHLNLKNKRQR